MPTQALRFNRGRFWLGANQLRVASAVSLAKGMPASNQRHRLLIIHAHPTKGLAHIAARGYRVGGTVGAFRIDIDQPHLHGSQGVFEVPVTRVALISQPFILGAPVDILFRLPDILTATGKTQGFKSHRFKGDIASKNHQVGPGYFPPIFLFDRPKQPARLIKVNVIWPAVEWGKTLAATAGATATITDPVGAGAVPGHANHQPAIVPPVGWPPILGVGHQFTQILFNRLQVQVLEFFSIVERLPHWIGLAGILVQDIKPQLIWPPILVGGSAPRGGHMTRKFTFFTHRVYSFQQNFG